VELFEKLFEEIEREIHILHPNDRRSDFMIISRFLRTLCQRVEAMEKQINALKEEGK